MRGSVIIFNTRASSRTWAKNPMVAKLSAVLQLVRTVAYSPARAFSARTFCCAFNCLVCQRSAPMADIVTAGKNITTLYRLIKPNTDWRGAMGANGNNNSYQGKLTGWIS